MPDRAKQPQKEGSDFFQWPAHFLLGHHFSFLLQNNPPRQTKMKQWPIFIFFICFHQICIYSNISLYIYFFYLSWTERNQQFSLHADMRCSAWLRRTIQFVNRLLPRHQVALWEQLEQQGDPLNEQPWHRVLFHIIVWSRSDSHCSLSGSEGSLSAHSRKPTAECSKFFIFYFFLVKFILKKNLQKCHSSSQRRATTVWQWFIFIQ